MTPTPTTSPDGPKVRIPLQANRHDTHPVRHNDPSSTLT